MIRSDRFQTIALCALLTLPLGAAGCSQGASPTEPAFDLDPTADSALTSTADDGRGRGRGGNEDGNVDRQGRRGRRGGDDREDDNQNNRRGRRGRGNDDRPDDRPQDPRPAGRQFEGAVASVGASSLTLANGTVVTVDGATQWVARGDLFSLADVSASLAGGFSPRVEGRGPRQADGSILARTIKAEDNR